MIAWVGDIMSYNGTAECIVCCQNVIMLVLAWKLMGV